MPTTRIRLFSRTALAVCVLAAACQIVLRADVTGSILGTVRDATSATIPNVTVTVTNVETNLTQTANSDAVGDYRFLALPFGTYKVQATASGFQTYIADNVVLTVNQERRVDITMNVGSLEQKVE